MFTFALASVPAATTFKALYRPPTSADVPGLVRAEVMTTMRLGSGLLSPERMQFREIAIFAAWESEDAIDDFLAEAPLGRTVAEGWHLRMHYLRRWGAVREFDDLPQDTGESDPQAPVAVYTLARMQLPEVPRFIRWGRPVEVQVRDHPETTLALAAIRHPRSVATFSIWTTQQAMTDMVRGRDHGAEGERHAAAMKERDRRDFHHEFTTLRFKPLSEHGSWRGRTGYVPNPRV